MAQLPVPVGETFANKYRVDRVIGEGGMGVVVLAYHLELEQPVAVKFLLDELKGHEEGAERFRREARAAAKIQSDHVVRVLDVGVLEGGERFMVMEYLEGRDLSEEIQERGTLPVGEACSYVLEALDAVSHAHEVGIIHRDLKPGNLFLAKRVDGSIRVKVLDFGISKSVGSASSHELSLTKTSAWIGSPLYMSPEQMQSARDVDARSDLWSLGAILFELLGGEPPYVAESLPQLCNLLLTRDPRPIGDLRPGLPSDLEAVIMKCLVRDPERRVQTAAELGVVLARHATSTTGSGRFSRQSFDETQLPPTHASPDPANGAQTAGGWGSTDVDSERRRGGAIGWVVAAAVVLVATVGILFARSSTDAEEAESPVEPLTAATATPAGSNGAEDGSAGRSEPKDEPREEPKEQPEAKLVDEPAPVAAPAVRPAPQPVVAPAVRPAPRPAPSSAPASPPPASPPPAPEPSGFGDFGGRR